MQRHCACLATPRQAEWCAGRDGGVFGHLRGHSTAATSRAPRHRESITVVHRHDEPRFTAAALESTHYSQRCRSTSPLA